VNQLNKSQITHYEKYCKTFEASSVIPDAYLAYIRAEGFHKISKGSRLMFPGENPELVEAALVVCGSSGSRF
jgi:hypothetical protein